MGEPLRPDSRLGSAMALCPLLTLVWGNFDPLRTGLICAGAAGVWLGLRWLAARIGRPGWQAALGCAVFFALSAGVSLGLGTEHAYARVWLLLVPVYAAGVGGERAISAWTLLSLGLVPLLPAPVESGGPAVLSTAAERGREAALFATVIAVAGLLGCTWRRSQRSALEQLDRSARLYRREARFSRLLADVATLANTASDADSDREALVARVCRGTDLEAARYWSVSRRSGGPNLRSQHPASEDAAPSPAVERARLSERVEQHVTGGTRYVAAPVSVDGRVVDVFEVRLGADPSALEGVVELVTQVAFHLGRIRERQQAAEALTREAHYDHLTQLSNRRAFHLLLDETVGEAVVHQRTMALLFIDLNGFKRINDSLGHDFGDALLLLVARRLRRSVRLTDHVCSRSNDPFAAISRIGGDEFTLILDEISDASDAELVAQRVLDTICAPARLRGREVRVGACIGIAVFPDDASTPSVLIQRADTAMYAAKERGTNGFQCYDPTLESEDEFAFEAALREALRESQLFMHYQPVFDAQDGSLVGAEALIRWQHPTEGLVPPGRFIPLAERVGLMHEVGVFQTEQALAWLEAARPDLPEGFRLALNISPMQIEDAGFVEWMASRLARSPLSMSQVELEITETALLVDTLETRDHLRALAGLGIRIALDDFGTGQSSLSLLKRLPIARLKIDRSFVSGLPDRGEDVAIVSAVLSLANDLGVPVVAEGVEEEDQQRFLAERGCQEIQGYLLARPMTGEQFLERYGRSHPSAEEPDVR